MRLTQLQYPGVIVGWWKQQKLQLLTYSILTNLTNNLYIFLLHSHIHTVMNYGYFSKQSLNVRWADEL